jgi:NAD(P)-dependent dehydrogenase (short-subunit alcohol dehydrogenase family)
MSEGIRLDNKVALVTGAASGLGKGIAVGLTSAGCKVAFTDIDEEGIEKAAAEVHRTVGIPLAVPKRMDVTNEKEVIACFDEFISECGHLDIVVSAAGIAPPYNLTDFPVASFRKALEINLTGYFLVSREAARRMIKQATGGSIIILTSKSGLQPSIANTAYNGTKAGEIHMARGWALELGEHNIRVNCVAPGNVFEGSQIWNPEYIKICAEKKGIKPEEVIPYYISLTALKKEIKRQDVANAVIFLCSEYASKITGQVLVVDSGQVMVR